VQVAAEGVLATDDLAFTIMEKLVGEVNDIPPITA